MNKKGFLLYIIVFLIVISYIYIIIKDNKNTIYESSVYKYEESSMNDNLLAFSENISYDEIKKEAYKLLSSNKDNSKEVLNVTNKYRKNEGKGELTLDDKLSVVANIRAIEMAYSNKFSHVRPNGTNYSEIFSDLDINTYSSGENIAFGYEDSDEVCVGWKESSGHYANMINSRYKKLGVGKYTYNGTTYWVQIFSN